MNLFQKDVARLLNVDEMTVCNWEKGATQPAVRCLPRIIEFLGYVPEQDSPQSFGEKLIQYRRRKGLSQKKVAGILEIDPSTLARWEQGRGKPSTYTFEKLNAFFRILDSVIIMRSGNNLSFAQNSSKNTPNLSKSEDI